MYKTDEEIIRDLLLVQWSEQDKRIFKALPFDEIIRYHSSLGRWIRNNYGLWREDNPYVNLKDSFHDRFPDQVSHAILEEVWKRLQ